MKLPDKVYDILSWFALIALDALGKFYQKIASIWGLPYGQEVFPMGAYSRCNNNYRSVRFIYCIMYRHVCESL